MDANARRAIARSRRPSVRSATSRPNTNSTSGCESRGWMTVVAALREDGPNAARSLAIASICKRLAGGSPMVSPAHCKGFGTDRKVRGSAVITVFLTGRTKMPGKLRKCPTIRHIDSPVHVASSSSCWRFFSLKEGSAAISGVGCWKKTESPPCPVRMVSNRVCSIIRESRLS